VKYFTKEELEDITKELLENPTRETLRNLNEKYNNEFEEGNTLVQPTPNVVEVPIEEPLSTPVEPMINEVVENGEQLSVEPTVVNQITNAVEEPVEVPAPSFNMTSMESPKVEPANNVVPSFELPKLETPAFNNQSNEPVNFSGNIFDTPSQPIGNLMQTTDNFNTIPNTMPSTEVPVAPAPFFVNSPEVVSNPIPVGGPINNMPNMGPSMFGQFEQNYM